MRFNKPILFYMIGYPGAGKTTLAKCLSDNYGCMHIYGDKMAFELFGIPKYTKEEADILYQSMDDWAIETLLSGRSVIYDVSANTYLKRRRLVGLAKSCHSLPVGLWVKTPLKVAIHRAGELRRSDYSDRIARTTPPAVFYKIMAGFEVIRSSEHLIISVSGVENASSQLEVINKGLTTIQPMIQIKLESQPLIKAN